MPTKGRALFAWLRNLSSPSSNIPLLLNLSVATLTLKQGAMALRNEQFFLPGSKTLPHRFVALCSKRKSYYCSTRPSISNGITDLKVPTFPQNFSDIFIVHTYFISMIVMSMAALIFLPAAMSVLALTMPCMPPILTSMVYLECRSWVDNGQTGVSFRVGLAITTYYYWTMVTSFIIISIIIVLLYPIEVKLIILEGIKRKVLEGGQPTHSNLMKYRLLQLLSAMHNFIFRQPAMPVLVGGITRCESFALYILITSASSVPLPVLLFFCVLAFELFILIVGPLKVMANPYITSVELLNSLRGVHGPKWVHRFVKSCPPSKLTLGDGTFFDSSASLEIWSKCVDLLITFILM
ncbi:hypothetical protein Fcan01_16513 [Folsomia candida]|uniref:Uncharacterized protein n=1 Tax=Folsomia candida TaxID=158441 RepID=A0A226DV56_FOLCA|nr:hypothetical protein Fcan01_16513 [Folsomia candida]